ncbi:MAG: TonB-dependent receptor [Bacteroidales bacterium]|nr:TonB-dependent receptor [Bacteroidales bacterium]
MVDHKLMPFIAAAGIEYKLIKPGTLTFKANIGRNLHVPNLDDLYFTPGGNPDLKPEEGYQSDAGLIWSDGIGNINYQFELTGFASRIDNWILWHPSEYRYWTADNVNKVFSRGAEMNGTVKGNLGSVKYQVRGNYGFTRTTNEDRMSDSYGMQLIYIPKHIGNAHLYLEKGTWFVGVVVSYTGARWTSTSEDNVHLMPYYYFYRFRLW